MQKELVHFPVSEPWATRMRRGLALFCSTGLLLALAIEAAAAESIAATGVVVPDRRVTLSARLSGRIVEISAEAGDVVQAGRALVKMDDAELQAELAKAKASAALAGVELEQARRANARLQRLFKSRTVSEDALDEVRYNAEAAAQRLGIAEAEVARVQALIREMRVLAPFDAVVTEKLAELGQLAAPGEPLLVIEDHSRLQFRTRVKEQDIPRIEVGQRVQVRIDALSKATVAGAITKIVPSGNDAHSFMVEAELDKLPKLYPGMFGKAEFFTVEPGGMAP